MTLALRGRLGTRPLRAPRARARSSSLSPSGAGRSPLKSNLKEFLKGLDKDAAQVKAASMRGAAETMREALAFGRETQFLKGDPPKKIKVGNISFTGLGPVAGGNRRKVYKYPNGTQFAVNDVYHSAKVVDRVGKLPQAFADFDAEAVSKGRDARQDKNTIVRCMMIGKNPACAVIFRGGAVGLWTMMERNKRFIWRNSLRSAQRKMKAIFKKYAYKNNGR